MRAFWKEHDEEKNRLLILKEKETKESATPPVLKCLYTSFHQYARQKSAGDCRRPPEAIAVSLSCSPEAWRTVSSLRLLAPRSLLLSVPRLAVGRRSKNSRSLASQID